MSTKRQSDMSTKIDHFNRRVGRYLCTPPRPVGAGLELVAAAVLAIVARAVLGVVVVGPLTLVESADLEAPPERRTRGPRGPPGRPGRGPPATPSSAGAATTPSAVQRAGRQVATARRRGPRADAGPSAWLSSRAWCRPERRATARASCLLVGAPGVEQVLAHQEAGQPRRRRQLVGAELVVEGVDEVADQRRRARDGSRYQVGAHDTPLPIDTSVTALVVATSDDTTVT